MFSFIKTALQTVRYATRDVVTGGKRSSQWPKIEHAFRASHPTCAACGGTEKLQVHHKQPFHLFPALELDPNNLITLCMGPNDCHLLIGHGDNFKMWNPNVEKDAAEALANPSERTLIVERAKAARKDGPEG